MQNFKGAKQVYTLTSTDGSDWGGAEHELVLNGNWAISRDYLFRAFITVHGPPARRFMSLAERGTI